MYVHPYVSPRTNTKVNSQFITSHPPFLVVILVPNMEPPPEVTIEPSLDVPHEKDDNRSDGDFDNESVSDGDGDFYIDGRIDFRKLLSNTDDNPIEFVYEYDYTGYLYSVYTRKKKDFVAKPVPADDECPSPNNQENTDDQAGHTWLSKQAWPTLMKSC